MRFVSLALTLLLAFFAGDVALAQAPPFLPAKLAELWEGGDRCGRPTPEQWALTLEMDYRLASDVVSQAKVIPYRFIVEDLVAAVEVGMEQRSPSVSRASAERFQEPRTATPASSGGSASIFGFTGQEVDPETGLIYMKARFYDPEIGRFLSEDPSMGEPMAPPSLHKYLYAHANPTFYVDPDGRVVESIWDAASLGLGLGALGYNLYRGNLRDAGIDILGVLADSAALALPFIPGGAGAAIKATRAGTATAQQINRARQAMRAVDAVQAVDQAVNVVDSTARAREALDHGSFGAAGFNTAVAVLGARGTVANSAAVRGGRNLDDIHAPRGPPDGPILITESASRPGVNAVPTLARSPNAPAAASSYRPGDVLPDGRIAGHGPGAALGDGPDFAASFGGVTAETAEEASFLRSVAATFGGSSVFSSAKRFSENIVVQRSDIPWSAQNVRRMSQGYTPYVKNAEGQWERVHLHHVGRKEGRLIEVSASHNRYGFTTGGRLHIPGPGGPVHDAEMVKSYWQERLQDAIDQGSVSDRVLRETGM